MKQSQKSTRIPRDWAINWIYYHSLFFILFIGFNLLGSIIIFIITGAIGSIFGMIGSVIGYKLTKSINGVWIGAIIGTVVGFGGCFVFWPKNLGLL
jgi:NADH:ubiquinone oxidoreductase subunit 6 (subunit J)